MLRLVLKLSQTEDLQKDLVSVNLQFQGKSITDPKVKQEAHQKLDELFSVAYNNVQVLDDSDKKVASLLTVISELQKLSENKYNTYDLVKEELSDSYTIYLRIYDSSKKK